MAVACERPLIFKIAVLSDFKKIILRIILEIRFLEGVILMSMYQEMWIQKISILICYQPDEPTCDHFNTT